MSEETVLAANCHLCYMLSLLFIVRIIQFKVEPAHRICTTLCIIAGLHYIILHYIFFPSIHFPHKSRLDIKHVNKTSIHTSQLKNIHRSSPNYYSMSSTTIVKLRSCLHYQYFNNPV